MIQNVTREQIIVLLDQSLQKEDAVYAFWLEGADASGLVDEYSDIDIWLDVQDGQEEAIFYKVEKILQENFGKFDFEYEQEQPHPQIRHKIYHIKNSKPWLLLDFCIQSHSREFLFTKNLPGEEVKVIFDKAEVVKFQDLDESIFFQEQKQRIVHLKHIFAQDSRVIKMIERGSFVDAFHFYYKFILLPLSELLRIKYAPKKQLFLKYISKDLPIDVAQELEQLYQITSLQDLSCKVQRAKKLLHQQGL